jgi:hypothetical protein
MYAKLAHGLTRNTFVCGEGSTLGVHPDHEYRSCYGTPNSTGNAVFLLALRLLLIRESFDDETGLPHGLYLAQATPRQWLEHGKRISIQNAPTCFGPVSYTIVSRIDEGVIEVSLRIPRRDDIGTLHVRLRLPRGKKISSVRVNGETHERFDAGTEVIDLSGLAGEVLVHARCD